MLHFPLILKIPYSHYSLVPFRPFYNLYLGSLILSTHVPQSYHTLRIPNLCLQTIHTHIFSSQGTVTGDIQNINNLKLNSSNLYMQFQLAPFLFQQYFHSVKSNHSPYKTNSTSFPFFKSFYHFASAEPMGQVFQLPPFLLKISLNFHPFFHLPFSAKSMVSCPPRLAIIFMTLIVPMSPSLSSHNNFQFT